VVFSVVNRVMMSTFQGIFGSVVKSIESDSIGLHWSFLYGRCG